MNSHKKELKKTMNNLCDTGIEFAESNRRFIRWMTTSSLASLGFFITVLLQIKSQVVIPMKSVAIVAFILLMICILAGFYARFRFEAKVWFAKVSDIIKYSLDIVNTALDEHLHQSKDKEDIDTAKANIDDLKSKINHADEIISKVNPAWVIFVQGISLVLGILTVAFYIFYYLFYYELKII